nr:Hint domain-containing protein [Maritimibacter sp. DP1N21-5]
MNATVTFYDQTSIALQIGVVQTQTGDTFAIIRDTEPELASQGIDRITFTSVATSNYTGVVQDAAARLDYVCFTSGTLIDTLSGPRRMDRLRPGDLVTTLDSGPQPVEWIGKRRIRFAERPHPAQPLCISRGAFGPGLPTRDLLLSPNHRVLVATSGAFALHDPLGALAPVKALAQDRGIRALPGRREITYFSMLLPRHEIVIANGIAVESLFPGPEAFGTLSGGERSDWLRLAARMGRLTGTPPARLMLSVAETRAARQAGLLSLPGTKPVPLGWSATRHAPRQMPEHLEARERRA